MNWRDLFSKKEYHIVDDDIIYDEYGSIHVKGDDDSVTRIDPGEQPKTFSGEEAKKMWTDLLSKLKG